MLFISVFKPVWTKPYVSIIAGINISVACRLFAPPPFSFFSATLEAAIPRRQGRLRFDLEVGHVIEKSISALQVIG